MKKTLLFAWLMLSALFAVSQTKVTFAGAMLDGSYCPFETVKVTNITKGWTETLVYPDTVLILSGTGVEEVSPSREGIMHVYPNPFEDFTDVEFGVLESGSADIRVVGVDGMLKASWEGYLPSGVHQVRVTLEDPQMALVVVTTERGNYVGKLLHVGEGGMNEIDVRSASPMFSERSNGLTRAGGDFTPGDMMSYEGMLRKCEEMIYSDEVAQAQFVDETITLAFPVSGIGGEVQSLPYYQSFENDFGTYLVYNEMGAKTWKINYNTAYMTGYDSGTNYPNEDWLISSPVDLTNVSHAKMAISYICRYFHSIDDDITVWASTDYNWCDNPMAATWTQLPALLMEGHNWSDFLTTEVALSEFVGQIVTIAVKYASSENSAGTIEIQSILIEEGDGPTPPGPGVEIQTLPYHQSFVSEFGTYMTYDVLGPQSWEIDYSTAKMSGYANSTNYANIDWLISSPVAITGVSDAKMTMAYIGRYFSNINEDVTVWASTNYTWGSDPSMASWTQVPAIFVEGSNWNDFITTEISLSEYVGQTVTFAVKYISTDSKAGTMEVQSITIEEGSGVTPPTPPTPGEGEGSGTFEDPYNVAAGIGLQSEEPIAWVHGYIVGAVKSGLTSVSSNTDINWSAPFDLTTNVVIADDATCHEISQCIIVNLPAGKPLRSEVNLVDHPDNLGKHLAVLGKLRRYFAQAGLRDSNGTHDDFVLEGATPPTPGTEIFSETFASGQGDFTIQDVFMPSELTYVWQHAPSYSCMKASAYVSGQNYAAESWLVSPAIDLSNVSAATLKFDQAVNYASPDGLSVMVSTNYAGEVLQCTWTELNLNQWPAGNNWTFINSTADLSQYVGQRVTIGFKYTSNSNASATWEVKNFVVE
jgi:hypothetical protein